MSTFNRTTIKSGPAILTWNGGTMYFKNGLTIEESIETFDVNVDTFAGADKRVNQVLARISGEPSGQWKNLGVWFPWLSAARGARLHGASDKAAVVKFLDGDVYTYHNAGLATMPDLVLSSTKTLMTGKVELECRTKNNTDPSDANSLVTRSTASFSDTSFSWDEVPTQVYSCSWSSDTEDAWNAFTTREGVKISAKPKWADLLVDDLGIADRELDMLEVTAQFTPVGITAADLDAKLIKQGSAGALRGARLGSSAEDLIVQGSGVYILMRKATCRKVPIQAGTTGKGRFGEVEAVASLGVATGAAEAQLLTATAEPA